MESFTHDELFDIRLALSDASTKWHIIYCESLMGKGNLTSTGARLVMEEYSRLHKKLVQMTET